eukprot:gene11093-23192_t
MNRKLIIICILLLSEVVLISARFLRNDNYENNLITENISVEKQINTLNNIYLSRELDGDDTVGTDDQTDDDPNATSESSDAVNQSPTPSIQPLSNPTCVPTIAPVLESSPPSSIPSLSSSESPSFIPSPSSTTVLSPTHRPTKHPNTHKPTSLPTDESEFPIDTNPYYQTPEPTYAFTIDTEPETIIVTDDEILLLGFRESLATTEAFMWSFGTFGIVMCMCYLNRKKIYKFKQMVTGQPSRRVHVRDNLHASTHSTTGLMDHESVGESTFHDRSAHITDQHQHITDESNSNNSNMSTSKGGNITLPSTYGNNTSSTNLSDDTTTTSNSSNNNNMTTTPKKTFSQPFSANRETFMDDSTHIVVFEKSVPPANQAKKMELEARMQSMMSPPLSPPSTLPTALASSLSDYPLNSPMAALPSFAQLQAQSQPQLDITMSSVAVVNTSSITTLMGEAVLPKNKNKPPQLTTLEPSGATSFAPSKWMADDD